MTTSYESLLSNHVYVTSYLSFLRKGRLKTMKNPTQSVGPSQTYGYWITLGQLNKKQNNLENANKNHTQNQFSMFSGQ